MHACSCLRAALPPPLAPRRVARPWRHRYRFVVLTVGLALCTALSLNANLHNFVMLCMQTEHEPAVADAHLQNALQWSMAVGVALGACPLVHAHARFGARRTLFWAALASALATAAVPAAVRAGFWPYSAVRFVQGIAYAADFAALGMLCAQWAPLGEQGLFLSVASSFSPASVSLGNTVAGWFCTTPWLGWRQLYYACAAFTLALAFAWAAVYADQPRACMQCTLKELERIERGKSRAHVELTATTDGGATVRSVPYGALFSSPLLWVCWLNAFADLCSGLFVLTYKPQYFHAVLGFSTLDTGWMTGLTSAVHIPLKLASGWASDRICFFSERAKLRLFNSISVGGAGLAYLGVAFAPSPMFAFACFCASSMCMAFAGGGFYKCGALHSRQYNHVVMAGIQLNKCAVLFIGPLLMALFVPNLADVRQWRSIFVAFAVLCFLANALFCAMATDQAAEFTTDEYHQRQRRNTDSAKGKIIRQSINKF